MAARLILRVVSGPFGDTGKLTVQHARIQGGQSITVGRNRLSADLGIRADPMMSGKHFRLHVDGDVCRLFDLESRNGTFVNEKRVSEALLRDGDEIRAGKTIFAVVIVGGAHLSSTEIEFGVVAPIETSPIEEGDVAVARDLGDELDALFDQMKERVRSRK